MEGDECGVMHTRRTFTMKRSKLLGIIIVAAILVLSVFIGCGADQKAREQVSKGKALLELGHLEEAIAVFQEAIRIQPDLTEAYLCMGTAYGQLQDWDRSRVAFKAAIKLNPESSVGYHGLGGSYMFQGRYGEAIEAFQEGIRLNPSDMDLRKWLAYCQDNG